ncbi:LuxR C-terminal-related transcriptional regulator [Escherichia coli]|uniref:LuxR C-terminal-related transcriptional regulator n=1 Tax=Escherichia coli TaxID=562 RepID=UPI0012FDDF4A|nr:LuxR C-terminal-related transcriptional regulator [Escherichia coli]MVV97814.1 helix-turn-helix transcriptional regulator [Escherichia coli]MWP12163.1 helix-turn-helix transcriptional regulator [Escherichia coli]
MTTVTLNVYLPDYNAEVTLTLPDVLTSTELSLLQMLLLGGNVSKIAQCRCRSIKTVSYQKLQIYRKLGIRNDLTLWPDLLLRYRAVLLETKNPRAPRVDNNRLITTAN